MRRLLLALTFSFALFCLAPSLHAQTEKSHDSVTPDQVTLLRWANSLIFYFALGYLFYRYAPPFFNARSADIQKAVQEATGLKLQGDFRRSEADKKMAMLPAEIEKIRREHDEALEREHQRVLQETEAESRRIQANIDAEIAALRVEGATRIRQRTADSAIALAERRLRDRLAAERTTDISGFLQAVARDNGQKGVL